MATYCKQTLNDVIVGLRRIITKAVNFPYWLSPLLDCARLKKLWLKQPLVISIARDLLGFILGFVEEVSQQSP